MEQTEESLYVIQDLHGLITPHMPCDQSRILAVNYSRLRYVDQYGSAFLKLTIELVNTTTGEDWTLSVLAKTLPKNSMIYDIGRVRTIFRKEVGLYTVARPAIDSYLKEKGMRLGEDFLVSTFGGRINLNGSKDVDNNAALLIRDYRGLDGTGYKTVHRRTGFDLDSTKAILAALARFHGATLSFKLTRPWSFKELVKSQLGKFSIRAANVALARDQLIGVLKSSGFPAKVVERALNTFNKEVCKEVREPWATFAHTNLWVKNVLVKYDKDRQPQDVKFKGLQESEYNSPLRDLLFFLFTSVQLVVLKQYLDELLDFYYHNLVNVLKNLDVDAAKGFSPSSFNQELRATASTGEFHKTVCMLYEVLGTNLEVQDVVSLDYPPDLTDPLHVNRLCYIVREFDKRDWLCS